MRCDCIPIYKCINKKYLIIVYTVKIIQHSCTCRCRISVPYTSSFRGIPRGVNMWKSNM